MADLFVEWQGLTIGGEPSPYHVQSITGWDDLPDITSYDQGRTRGHGDHVGAQFAQSRIVTVEGTIADPAARDDLVRALNVVTSVATTGLDDLTVTTFGTSLSSPARLLRRSVSVRAGYAAGLIPFALQWKCPDPLRYGAELAASAGLPTDGAGLEYGLAYDLDYGDPGTPGAIVLTNEGTADTPIQFEVTGPLPLGFEISAIGQRLTYAGEVPAGQVVLIDTADGSALVEGMADRRGNLSWADWIQVPAGRALTVTFASLGGAFSAEAQLRARWKPAYW